MTNQILYRGAEAEIRLSTYMGRTVVQKSRVKKPYRIKEIDEHLIASRTREEAKLMTESRAHGVSVPIIYDIDLFNGIITMEYIKGPRLKDILNSIDDFERKRICQIIGENIAQLHNHDIIHGDLTTSNMILLHDRIYFIDFGLGCKTIETETKAVDLHVLMEAFESTHSKHSYCFDHVIDGYKRMCTKDGSIIITTITEIVQRGRYR